MVARIVGMSLPVAFSLFASTHCGGATVEAIAKGALPSVVEIITYDASGAEVGQGSGFFISPCKIVTNEHVVDGAYSARVYTDNNDYTEVTILNTDCCMDLAILKVDAEGEVPLTINRDAKLKPGQRVVVIGHPLGLEKTLSEGVISGVQTTYRGQDVRITAPVSHGSSGGPVLDDQGRVIGVVYALIPAGQNLNFAVGVETLTQFLALEESPRRLEVAGSYVPWRLVLSWLLDVVAGIVALTTAGCLIVLVIMGNVRLWRVVCWLCRFTFRFATWLFTRRHAARPALREAWRFLRQDRDYYSALARWVVIATVLLIAGSWLRSATVRSATKPPDPPQPIAAQTRPAPATDAQTTTVYITRTGTKYHRPGCRYLRKSKIPIPLKEAKQHYSPCSVCNPPR